MKSRIFLVLVALLLMVTPVSTPAAAQADLQDLTLFLGFIPNIQFAPVYMALEKGYFEEAGVNVTLEYGDENVGVERIAAGELQFGIVSGEQVLLARAGGRPLVYVFEWWQRYPVGIVAPADAGITSVADLAGRVVGIPGRFGASYTGLRTMLSASGMTEADIQLEEIGFNAAAMVCADRVEAAVVYTANEPVQIQEQCSDVTVIEASTLADLLANGLVTNEETIANNPELVRGMVSAMARAVTDVIASPDDAMRVSRRYVETLPAGGSRVDTSIAAADAIKALRAVANSEQPLSAEAAGALADALAEQVNNDEVIQMRVLLNAIEQWKGAPVGFTDPASWEVTQQALVDMGLVPQAQDLTTMYTNEFLP